MPHSIGRRIRRTVFTVTIICILTTGCLIFFASESMEQTMLTIDSQTKRAFLLNSIEPTTTHLWKTNSLEAFYVPTDKIGLQPPPALFHGLPFPFSGEIEKGNQTFLVTIDKADAGRLYLANNITLFEQRELLFTFVLLLICVGVIALSFILSRLSSRRLIVPLQQLAKHIGDTRPGRRMLRVPPYSQDTELATIADTFNAFLEEMESYIKREQSLLGLASHELRTPIAVVAGALEIIEERGQLCTEDERTLERAQNANNEMAANVDMILNLARHKRHAEQATTTSLSELIQTVLTEIDAAIGTSNRVSLATDSDVAITADPVLVNMLLRNLIQNALQHTAGPVQIKLTSGYFEITDHGSGLPEPYRRLLTKPTAAPSEIAELSGLGLFIVTLVCERLGWQPDVMRSSNQGTVLRFHFNTQYAQQTS